MNLPHTTKVSGVNCAVLVVECYIISMLLKCSKYSPVRSCGVTVYEVRGKNIIITLKDFLTTATMLYSRNGLKNSF